MIHWTGVPALISFSIILLSIILLVRGDKRGEKVAKLGLIAVIISWFLYLIPFATLDFTLHEVAYNTSVGMPLWMRIASSWAGGGGSLFLFTFFAAVATLILMKTGRRFLIVALLVVDVGLAAAFANDAFTYIPASAGIGLNPLLKSFWLYPHPLTTFGGYALLVIASLALYFGSRRGRAIYAVGWALLTLGIMIGGLWSYETFGWGGYWAWDPVETSELMVWLMSTLYPHLIVVIPSLANTLTILIPSVTFLAMYVTRSGLSPLHSFAAATIGNLLLIIPSLFFLAAWIVKLINTKIRVKVIKTPYYIGMALASLSLGIAAFFVWGTLLVPSILTLIGQQGTVPQMDSGIAYFHPVLYPLLILLLVAIPMVFLENVGWRGIITLETTVLILASLYAIYAYRTLELAPLSSPEVNAQMAFGLVIAVMALLSALYAIRKYPNLSVLHVGMALTAIGILMSGAYAYGEEYMIHYVLKPHQILKMPMGYTISLEKYKYWISNDTVDIYTPYVGRTTTYFFAHETLRVYEANVQPFVDAYRLAERLIKNSPLLEELANMIFQSPCTLDFNTISCDLGRTENVSFSGILNVTDLTNGQWKVLGKVHGILMNFNPQLYVVMQSNISWITFGGIPEVANFTVNLKPSPHLLLTVKLDKPILLNYDGSQINVTSFTLVPRASISKGKGWVSYVKPMIFFTGYFHGVEQIELPIGVHNAFVTYIYPHVDALYAQVLKTSLRNLTEQELKRIIFDPSCANNGCIAFVRAPRLVPATAYNLITLRVGDGRVEALLRFEVNGEIQGIHGLVTKVLHMYRGLDDVYIALQPPSVTHNGMSFHDLMLYYLHKVGWKMSLSDRVALTALLASGYYIDFLKRSSPTQRPVIELNAFVNLYYMAENYTSAIPKEGITLMVKVIPGAPLVFWGPVIMAIGAILGIIMPHLRTILNLKLLQGKKT